MVPLNGHLFKAPLRPNKGVHVIARIEQTTNIPARQNIMLEVQIEGSCIDGIVVFQPLEQFLHK